MESSLPVMAIKRISFDRMRYLWHKLKWLTRDKKQVFRFMDLPLEIRRLIYAHVIDITPSNTLPMPLAAISHRVRAEALDVMFETSYTSINNNRDIPRCLRNAVRRSVNDVNSAKRFYLDMYRRLKHVIIATPDVVMIISTLPKVEKAMGYDPITTHRSYACTVESSRRRVTFALPYMRFHFRSKQNRPGMMHSIEYLDQKPSGPCDMRLGDYVVEYWAHALFNIVDRIGIAHEQLDDDDSSLFYSSPAIFEACDLIKNRIEDALYFRCYFTAALWKHFLSLEVEPEWLRAAALPEGATSTVALPAGYV
jgi:hypothetical protein